jgi:hypothetical protein
MSRPKTLSNEERIQKKIATTERIRAQYRLGLEKKRHDNWDSFVVGGMDNPAGVFADPFVGLGNFDRSPRGIEDLDLPAVAHHLFYRRLDVMDRRKEAEPKQPKSRRKIRAARTLSYDEVRKRLLNRQP